MDPGEVPGSQGARGLCLEEQKYRESADRILRRGSSRPGRRGARKEAIKEPLRQVDIDKLGDELREKMRTDARPA